MKLDVTDLFLVGLALDITGAVVIARGLLIKPVAIGKVAGSFFGGNQAAPMDRCESRVDGVFGVGFLAAGFVFQAAGYAIKLGTGTNGGSGTGRLVAATVLALLALVVAASSYWAARGFFLKRTVLAMARDKDEREDRADGARPGEWSADKVKELIVVAHTKWPQEPQGEGHRAYVKRVFGVQVPKFPDLPPEPGDQPTGTDD